MLQSVLRSTHDRSLNKYSEVDEEDDFQEVLDPPPIAAATQYQVGGLCSVIYRAYLELCQFLKFRNRELRFFMPVCEMRNCE